MQFWLCLALAACWLSGYVIADDGSGKDTALIIFNTYAAATLVIGSIRGRK